MATFWLRVSDDVDVDPEMLRGHLIVPDLKSPVDEQAKYVSLEVGRLVVGIEGQIGCNPILKDSWPISSDIEIEKFSS